MEVQGLFSDDILEILTQIVTTFIINNIHNYTGDQKYHKNNTHDNIGHNHFHNHNGDHKSDHNQNRNHNHNLNMNG